MELVRRAPVQHLIDLDDIRICLITTELVGCTIKAEHQASR